MEHLTTSVVAYPLEEVVVLLKVESPTEEVEIIVGVEVGREVTAPEIVDRAVVVFRQQGHRRPNHQDPQDLAAPLVLVRVLTQVVAVAVAVVVVVDLIRMKNHNQRKGAFHKMNTPRINVPFL